MFLSSPKNELRSQLSNLEKLLLLREPAGPLPLCLACQGVFSFLPFGFVADISDLMPQHDSFSKTIGTMKVVIGRSVMRPPSPLHAAPSTRRGYSPRTAR